MSTTPIILVQHKGMLISVKHKVMLKVKAMPIFGHKTKTKQQAKQSLKGKSVMQISEQGYMARHAMVEILQI